MKTNINLRQEIITLIRGYFITPVIGSLAKNNYFKDKKILQPKSKSEKIILNYLQNLGYVKKIKNKLTLTLKGKKIFSRSGSFNIVNSYRNYVLNIDDILKNPKKLNSISCDRKEMYLVVALQITENFLNQH